MSSEVSIKIWYKKLSLPAILVHQSGELEELLEKNKIIEPETEPEPEAQTQSS